VGQQPVIPPGCTFEYTSGSLLSTPAGTMQGQLAVAELRGLRPWRRGEDWCGGGATERGRQLTVPLLCGPLQVQLGRRSRVIGEVVSIRVPLYYLPRPLLAPPRFKVPIKTFWLMRPPSIGGG
jgi:hypothetical protein